MLERLRALGLTGKKLAVFDVGASANIASLLCKEHGVICEQWHVDWITELIMVAQHGEPFAKRLRGDHHQDPLRPDGLDDRRDNLTSSCKVPFQSHMSADDQLRTRPARRRAHGDGEDGARAKREAEQKEFLSRELFLELKKFGAPSLDHLEHCVPDRHLHLALAGRTRYNTLKRYLKTWKGFMQWVLATKGFIDYPEPGDLVEYLFARYDEPCGPTIPGLIVKAVTWMERTADFDSRQRVGEAQVVASVRDYIIDMLSKDSSPLRKAPRYPAVFVESLEAMVEDEKFILGFRVVAWIKLVKN